MLFQNDYMMLEEKNSAIYITVLKKGFLIKNFDQVLEQCPRVFITKFLPLKEALENAENTKILIGELKPEISLTIQDNKMAAKIRLNCPEEDLAKNQQEYVNKILGMLHENGVKEGILDSVLQEGLTVQHDLVIAQGIEPTDGEDAQINYFQLSERKPTILEDGKADFYDMNFIDEVREGDWLGEKIPPTQGIPGKTITGEALVPKPGKDKILLYDKKTVRSEMIENGKTVLRALSNGVVRFTGGKISVGRHLVIEGDVGVGTGNIEFDGSMTVKGIIQPGYSITAKEDISILGEMGVSGVDTITSIGGDIFIKGGVFGSGESLVRAEKNIFVKHANDCILEAGEDIFIGYYSMGSSLKGRNIIADEKNGKIIGGTIEAKGKVIAGVIGNKMERKTVIEVQGIDRIKTQQQLEELLTSYKIEVKELERLKRNLEFFEDLLKHKRDIRLKDYEIAQKEFDEQLSKIALLDDKRKYYVALLEIKGEGQVTIQTIAYPETALKIKNVHRQLYSPVKGTFFAERNHLYFE